MYFVPWSSCRMIGSVPNIRAVVAAMAAVATAATVLAAPAASAAAHTDPVLVAHRNGAAVAPENTLAAVWSAYAARAGRLETDVQRTRDGRLVLMHDGTLKRTTNVEHVYPKLAPYRVRDLTLRQIERLDAGSWFAKRYRGERVPTLGRYLRTLDRTGQGALLEIKNPELYPGIVAQVAAALRRHGWLDAAHRGRLIVQSFSATAVREFHRREPATRTALIAAPTGEKLRAAATYADVISPKYTHVTRAYVRAVHRLHGAHGHPLKIAAWTIDDRATAHRMAADGVDAIISDDPKLRP